MATDEFNSSYGYLLKLMVNTPSRPFYLPCLLSVPRLILTSRTGTPKLHHPIQPAFVMLPSEKALLLSRLCLLVHQRIRRMHCLARRRVRHLRQTEIRSQLLRGKEACDVAGFSAFSHEKKHKIGTTPRIGPGVGVGLPMFPHEETTSPSPVAPGALDGGDPAIGSSVGVFTIP